MRIIIRAQKGINSHIFNLGTIWRVGRDSSVGIATRYALDGTGIESRWEEVRFSAPVQTGPGANLAPCTMGTGSFPGGKAAGA
jgi:hypothetical protein